MAGLPSSCPWVTSVGGTTIPPYEALPTSGRFSAPEKVWQNSGGGFSLIFDRPWYQHDAVTRFFADYPPDLPDYDNGHHKNSSGAYNRDGRGFPDVSAGKYGKALMIPAKN